MQYYYLIIITILFHMIIKMSKHKNIFMPLYLFFLNLFIIRLLHTFFINNIYSSLFLVLTFFIASLYIYQVLFLDYSKCRLVLIYLKNKSRQENIIRFAPVIATMILFATTLLSISLLGLQRLELLFFITSYLYAWVGVLQYIDKL